MLALQALNNIVTSAASTLGIMVGWLGAGNSATTNTTPVSTDPLPITKTEIQNHLRPHLTLGPALRYLGKEFRERPFTNGAVITSLLGLGAFDFLKKVEIATVLRTQGTVFESIGHALQWAGLGNLVMAAGLGLGTSFMIKGRRAATRLIGGQDRTSLHQARIDYGSGILSITMILATIVAFHGFRLEDNFNSQSSTAIKLLMTLGHSGDELMAIAGILRFIRKTRGA